MSPMFSFTFTSLHCSCLPAIVFLISLPQPFSPSFPQMGVLLISCYICFYEYLCVCILIQINVLEIDVNMCLFKLIHNPFPFFNRFATLPNGRSWSQSSYCQAIGQQEQLVIHFPISFLGFSSGVWPSLFINSYLLRTFIKTTHFYDVQPRI